MKRLRSRKALSPVVASIILIAVTVAVSIAVAAWMGALTFNFMATEQVSITSLDFTSGTTVTAYITNSGTNEVVINLATWNGVSATVTSTILPANSAGTPVIVTVPAWTNGYTYTLKLTSQKGNSFVYTAVAPTA